MTSTNDTVLAAGEAGAPTWTIHIARRQLRGRGRGSHAWWSPTDRGLWMSVLLRPRLEPRRLGGIALIAGVAVRDALLSLGGQGITVHWPNDLMLGRRKVGGILGEVRSRREPPETIVALGLGLNIDLSGIEVPAELRGSIASLAEAGVLERKPDAIAVKILQRIGFYLAAIEEGEESIPSLVRGSIAGLGRPVRVRIPPAPAWSGIAAGIGEEGELLVLRDGGGVEAIRAAEVDYEP